MDGVAIGLGLLVAGAVVVFVVWPWWTRRGAPQPESGDRVRSGGETLAERHEAVLTALRDLDFDHAVGKVAEEDYEPLRQALLVGAGDVIAQLDEEQAKAEADLDARIEAEVLAIRQTRRAEEDATAPASYNACPACGRVDRPGDVYCADCGAQLNASCSVCGRTAGPTDLFCVACGTELAVAIS
jgi:ribosomal protein L32